MKKIAFFDSGVGGLSVLHLALNKCPSEEYIYYADTDHVPYGTKTSTEIEKYVKEAVSFLSQQNLKALVIACNTATSVVIQELRAQYDFPIVGMEPAIKPAAQIREKKILLCATDRTLVEEKLSHLISDLDIHDRVEKMSLQELVMYGEHFDFHNPAIRTYLEQKFESLDWEEYGSVVLGCTHFLFFKRYFRTLIPAHIQIVDGNLGTINRLISLIELNQSVERQPVSFYQSGRQVSELYYDHYIKYLEENP